MQRTIPGRVRSLLVADGRVANQMSISTVNLGTPSIDRFEAHWSKCLYFFWRDCESSIIGRVEFYAFDEFRSRKFQKVGICLFLELFFDQFLELFQLIFDVTNEA